MQTNTTLVQTQQCEGVAQVGIISTLLSLVLQTLSNAQCQVSGKDDWPEDYAEEYFKSKNSENLFDFIIVGAGSAGSVLASRLSENRKWRILVLEAGGNPPQESEVPSLFLPIQHTNYTFNYYTESNPNYCLASKGKRCYWPRGRFIGGSGGVNAMLYIRGNRRDYDSWLKLGNSNWGYDDVWPYFQKSTDSNSSSGFVKISRLPIYDTDMLSIIANGAQELGVKMVDDFVEGSYLGYAHTPQTIYNGRRASTGKTYLADVAKERSNLKVIKFAQVTKLNFENGGKRVDSIEFLIGGKNRVTAKANKEIILSAGTIDTPKILLLSGVGPENHLKKLNIPTIHALPVGKNLKDHVFVSVGMQLMEDYAEMFNQQQNMDNLYEYLMYSRGPLSTIGITSFTGFINTNNDTNDLYPDIELHHFGFRRGDFPSLKTFLNSFSIAEEYHKHYLKLQQNNHVLIVIAVLAYPESRGSIELKSTNPQDPPLIDANYFSHPNDLKTILRGIDYIMKLEQTLSFRQTFSKIAHIPIEECDKFEFKTSEYWTCYAKYFSGTIYHHGGTVKMSPLTKDLKTSGCVNDRLKLHYVDNLRVVDASIMPEMISCNINAATIMIAERAADFIKDDWRQHSTQQEM